MNDKLQAAIESSRTEIVTAAEAKLGRQLSSEERAGVERISSLMMLESVYRSFSFPDYSAAEVESDLRRFAAQAQ